MNRILSIIILTAYGIFVNAQTAWTPQNSGTLYNLKSVFFTGANTGYAVGVNGTILKTTNGGSTWTAQTSGTNNTLNTIFFIDANIGFAAGDGGDLLKTTNGGTNWTYLSSGTIRSIYSIYFTDANSGYIAGGFYYNGSSYSVIRKTTNGGTTWTSQASGTSVEIRSIYFADSITGYASGYYGAIYKTINGGTQWTQKNYNTISYNYLYSLSFPDNNTAYAVGVGKIVKTSNAGNNWNETFTSNLLNSVYFTDTSTGFAVGYHGIIMHTQNGGVNWAEEQSGTTANLNAVYFTNPNIGYAVGDSGIILKTTIGSAPTAGNNGAVCEGSTIYLTASTIAGATYSWTGPNGFTSTFQNPVITSANLAMNGIYYVTSTFNGNTSPAGPTSVVVYPIPPKAIASSNSPVVTSTSILLLASTIAGASYNWTGPNSFSSTLQNPSISNATLAMTGYYKVWVTKNGCSSSIDSTLVTVNNFTPYDSACGTEEFNNGITAPLGWTYTNINTTYTTAINCGNLIPSLMLDATGDIVETAPVHNVSKLSFWIKGNSTDITSALLIQGYTGSTWATVDNITNISAIGTTKIYTNVAAYQRFKFTYFKSAGNLAFDDLEVVCGTPPLAPTAANNGPVCVGSALSLTASSITNASYNWTGPNGFTSTQQNPTVSMNATLQMSGSYAVTATVNGISSPAATTVVVVNPLPTAPTVGNDTSICSGMPLSLTAALITGATYSWVGPNGFISTQQNPTVSLNATAAMTGSYSVTSIVNGCSSVPVSCLVTIKATPSAPVAGNNGPLCAGSLLSLIASSLSGALYSWTGPLGFTSTQQNPSVSSNAVQTMSGSYSVTATVNGCTNTAGTTTATVNSIPSAPTASNNGPVCAASVLSLTASTISGAVYSWTGPNGFTSTQQNPTVSSNATAAMSGIYSVTASINACLSAAGTTTVTVKALPSTPVAGNNGPLCTGSLLSLTASTISGAVYSWTGPNGFTSTQQNPTVSSNATTAMSGIYSVTASVNGCSNTAGTTTATVKAIPSAPIAGNNGAVTVGSMLTLYASTISGASYSWTGPEGFVSGLQNPLVSNSATLVMAGIYYVTANVNSCVSLAASTSVVVNQVIPADSACGIQAFNNGTTAPSSWTFTNITMVYNTAANAGNAVPSLSFDASGDAVETAPVHDVSKLSFWIKGVTSDPASALLIQGYNGSSWTTIDNISNLPAAGTIKTYTNLATYSRFKFLYIQSAGNLAFDDVEIICGGLGLADKENANNLLIYPNPCNGEFVIQLPDNTQQLNIYSALGQTVSSIKTRNEKKIMLSLEMEGIYFVRLQGLYGTITKKLVVSR
ncbi:MAG: YCF48-related protein [Bacteroidota bacterium]